MKIKEFFYLQKSDRQVLLVLLAVFVIATGLYCAFQKPTNDSYKASISGKLASERTSRRSVSSNRYYAVPTQTTELFPFDPNTADSNQLLRLGLQEWQVRNIYRYRAKGGVYRQPEDFARVYGLTVKQYRALAPYIRISPDYRPASTLYPGYSTRSGEHRSVDVPASAAIHSDLSPHPIKLSPGEQVALNLCDTTALQRVPGIGPYFARAILRYGARLGGYVSTNQLLEIEGFPEESLPYFTVGATALAKLKVNELSLSQLRKHPYISFYQAKAITDYRRLHGRISSLRELSLLDAFPAEAITRLEPYVEY